MKSKVTIVLDDGITRMCLKYHINPETVMIQALEAELHTKATTQVLSLFSCPHQNVCNRRRFDKGTIIEVD